MSNAIANSDANNFDNDEVADPLRGRDLKGKFENLSFPSVEILIAETLPFENSEDLLQRILICWQKTFKLNQCGLLWKEKESRIVHLTKLDESSESRFSSLSIDDNEEDLIDVSGKFDPRCAAWRWISLKLDGNSIGHVGLDQTCGITFPTHWLHATARLLATAQRWEQTLRQKKLDALGEYAAGAGHEINNPLAAIKGRAAQLLQEESDPHRQHLLNTIGAQTYRIRDMIGDSMLFARPPEIQLSTINLTKLIESVVYKFTDEFAERKISLWGRREPDVLLRADETQLCIVIAELIRNALNAVQQGGRIEIDCYRISTESKYPIVLRVADNGMGFTEEEREHCFDPFYSGRQAGRGLGFGLSKCWRIVTEHNGNIRLHQSKGELTEFLITLRENLSTV